MLACQRGHQDGNCPRCKDVATDPHRPQLQAAKLKASLAKRANRTVNPPTMVAPPPDKKKGRGRKRKPKKLAHDEPAATGLPFRQPLTWYLKTGKAARWPKLPEELGNEAFAVTGSAARSAKTRRLKGLAAKASDGNVNVHLLKEFDSNNHPKFKVVDKNGNTSICSSASTPKNVRRSDLAFVTAVRRKHAKMTRT